MSTIPLRRILSHIDSEAVSIVVLWPSLLAPSSVPCFCGLLLLGIPVFAVVRLKVYVLSLLLLRRPSSRSFSFLFKTSILISFFRGHAAEQRGKEASASALLACRPFLWLRFSELPLVWLVVVAKANVLEVLSIIVVDKALVALLPARYVLRVSTVPALLATLVLVASSRICALLLPH